MHPWFNEAVHVLRHYGPDAVWVEREDGRCTILPVAWTSLQPRAKPLKQGGRLVRLSPAALQAPCVLGVGAARGEGHRRPTR